MNEKKGYRYPNKIKKCAWIDSDDYEVFNEIARNVFKDVLGASFSKLIKIIARFLKENPETVKAIIEFGKQLNSNGELA